VDIYAVRRLLQILQIGLMKNVGTSDSILRKRGNCHPVNNGALPQFLKYISLPFVVFEFYPTLGFKV